MKLPIAASIIASSALMMTNSNLGVHAFASGKTSFSTSPAFLGLSQKVSKRRAKSIHEYNEVESSFSRRRTHSSIKLNSAILNDDPIAKFGFMKKKKSPVVISTPEADSSQASYSSVTMARLSVTSYAAQFVGESGASIVYSKLQEHGVSVVNGYSGGAVLPVLDQFHEGNPRHFKIGALPPIQWITNSNESSAGHIAEGIAKSSTEEDGHLAAGVVVATSGPGVTNLVTPITDAMCDGVPLIVLCGQAATVAPPAAFQSCPAAEILRPVTKWSYQIKSAVELPFVMDYAFFVARSGRPGPVFIDLPKDLQNEVLTPENINEYSQGIKVMETNGEEDHSFIQFVEQSSTQKRYTMKLGNAKEGLYFHVKQNKLIPTKSSQFSEFQHDHHSSDMIYKGTPIENENANSSNQGELNLNSEMMGEMVDIIRHAKKPVIIAGQGCNDASDELLKFAESLNIPVTTTLHGLGCFDERHPLALNMLGMHGHATPNFMVQESDLIICIGSRFDDRITGKISEFVPEARNAAKEERGGIIHVDIRYSENSKQIEPTYFVHSSGKAFLEAVNKKIEHLQEDIDVTQTKPWLAKMKLLQEQYPVKVPKFPTYTVQDEECKFKTPMSAQSVVREINRQLLEANKIDDSIITTGVGIHQMVTAQFMTWTRPRQLLSSGSLGTMGVSLGYSIGAKLANMGKIVISIDGDGSFNMSFTELKTVGERKIPIKIIILDNDGQMMVEYWQKLFHDDRLIATRNAQNPNYTKLADSFGIKNLYCDCEEDLPVKMKEFLFSDPDEPVLFHVRINRSPCLPMVAPGAALDNMILSDADQDEAEFDACMAPS